MYRFREAVRVRLTNITGRYRGDAPTLPDQVTVLSGTRCY
jgi:hypothetical protein